MTRNRRTRSRFPAWYWWALMVVVLAALVGLEDRDATAWVAACAVGTACGLDAYRARMRA